MAGNKLLFLKNVFSKYEVQFSDNYTKAVILNPFYNENITVSYYEDDDFTPYCVFFSFQHCHLADKEDVVDWINEIITGRKYSIEFFRNGQNCFGAEITSEELNDLSYEKLKQFSGYYGLTKLFEIADCFKVRGWNNSNNFDAEFVLQNQRMRFN